VESAYKQFRYWFRQ